MHLLKNQLQVGKQDVCDTTSQVLYNEDIENTSKGESSFSSTAVELDSSNQNANLSSDMSFNLQFSDNTDSYENTNFQQTLNSKNFGIVKKNDKVCDAQQSSTVNKKEDQLMEVRSPKTAFETDQNQEKVVEVENSHTELKTNQDLNKECLSIDQGKFASKDGDLKTCNSNKKDKSLISVGTKDKEKNINKIQIPKLSSETNKIATKVNGKTLFISQNTNLEKGEKYLETDKEKAKSMAYNKIIPKTYKNNNIKKLKEKAGNSEFETKPNENVVFSVAKITLNDEDNLFTIDSDSSSGKSFYVCEPKSMDSNEDLEGKSFNTNNSCRDDGHKENSCHIKLNESTENSKISLSPAREIVEQFVEETGTKDTESCTKVLNLSLSLKNRNELEFSAEEIEGAKNEGRQEDIDTSKNVDCTEGNC